MSGRHCFGFSSMKSSLDGRNILLAFPCFGAIHPGDDALRRLPFNSTMPSGTMSPLRVKSEQKTSGSSLLVEMDGSVAVGEIASAFVEAVDFVIVVAVEFSGVVAAASCGQQNNSPGSAHCAPVTRCPHCHPARLKGPSAVLASMMVCDKPSLTCLTRTNTGDRKRPADHRSWRAFDAAGLKQRIGAGCSSRRESQHRRHSR